MPWNLRKKNDPTPKMPMTPEERAEKIYLYMENRTSEDIPFIAVQIREAEKEAISDKQKWMAMEPWIKKAREEGFNAAKEKAADLVQNWPKTMYDLEELVSRIRQMEAE